jgi:tellurite resistance protein
MLEALRADPRLAHQFLLLAHLYARADGWALAWLRATLLRPRCAARR